jgi:hypothetical protein
MNTTSPASLSIGEYLILAWEKPLSFLPRLKSRWPLVLTHRNLTQPGAERAGRGGK